MSDKKEKDLTAKWVRFFPMKFMSSIDVMMMETDEIGAYCLLLFASFPTGGYLPDDDETLRRITKLSKKSWTNSKVRILKKFASGNGKIWNDVWVSEIINAEETMRNSHERAVKGAKKRWNKENEMLEQSSGTTKPTNEIPEPDATSISTSNAQASIKDSSLNADYITLHNITIEKVIEPPTVTPNPGSEIPKVEKPIKEKKEPETLHPKMMKYYFDFFNKEFLMEPKIDATQGKALNDIIKYFSGTSKRYLTEKEKREPTETEIDDRVLYSWKWVLDNFNLWDPPKKNFHKIQTKLSQINSNIQNIIVQIKTPVVFNQQKTNSKVTIREDIKL